MESARLDDGRYAELVESLVESMLYGRKVLVRTLPRAGRTSLLHAVAIRYRSVAGFPPIHLGSGDGLSAGECVAELRASVSAHGTAAVLLDDWEEFLKKGSWQPRLNAVCVDGPNATAIGVLLTTRAPSRSSLRVGPESPLVDAVNEVRGLPPLSLEHSVRTLVDAGIPEEEATRIADVVGCHPEMILGAISGDLEGAARESALQIAAALGADGTSRLVELSRRPGLTLPLEAADERLVPAVHRVGDRVSVARGLLEGGLLDMLAASGSSWPEVPEASARRLAARLLAGAEPIWFDRYLVGAIPELLDMLDRVVRFCQGSTKMQGSTKTLRLLSGPARGAEREHLEVLRARIDGWQREGVSVFWHSVDARDIADLHARQVIYSDRVDGYSMPPADRIVGRVPPGNENDAYLSKAPAPRVRQAWERSTCWCCASTPSPH